MDVMDRVSNLPVFEVRLRKHHKTGGWILRRSKCQHNSGGLLNSMIFENEWIESGSSWHVPKEIPLTEYFYLNSISLRWWGVLLKNLYHYACMHVCGLIISRFNLCIFL